MRFTGRQETCTVRLGGRYQTGHRMKKDTEIKPREKLHPEQSKPMSELADVKEALKDWQEKHS